MPHNRSIPTNTVLPHIFYKDVAKAVEWLTSTFGFIEHYRYGDPETVSGAQMHLGDAWIMVQRAGLGVASPAQLRYGTQSLTIFVDDVDAHFERAKSAGAKIVEDHVRDVSPEEWGAKLAGR